MVISKGSETVATSAPSYETVIQELGVHEGYARVAPGVLGGVSAPPDSHSVGSGSFAQPAHASPSLWMTVPRGWALRLPIKCLCLAGNVRVLSPPMKNVIQSGERATAMRGAKDPVEVTQNDLAVHALSIGSSQRQDRSPNRECQPSG
jgi:hypothetical protein